MTDRPGGPDLAPDEKLCPFCAEPIKRAAIKCRYCQSELPPVAPAFRTDASDAAGAPVAAEPPAPPPPAPRPVAARGTAADRDEDLGPESQGSRAPWLGSVRLMIGLLVLCLVLVGLTAFGWFRSQQPADAASTKDPVTSTSARDAGLQAATRLTQKIFSYDWKTFDRDATSSESVLGPTFRKEYASTIAKTRSSAVANQVKQTATASASSVVSASQEKVVALVFLNVLASGKAGGQRVTTSRLLVTLTPAGGDWRISQLKQL